MSHFHYWTFKTGELSHLDRGHAFVDSGRVLGGVDGVDFVLWNFGVVTFSSSQSILVQLNRVTLKTAAASDPCLLAGLNMDILIFSSYKYNRNPTL